MARPSSASRRSSSAAAVTAAAGSGPSVPAFRYASRLQDGKPARNPDRSTNRENTRMPDAPRQTPLWEPTAQDRERAEMTRFMRWAGERHGRTFADYAELWRLVGDPR